MLGNVLEFHSQTRIFHQEPSDQVFGVFGDGWLLGELQVDPRNAAICSVVPVGLEGRVSVKELVQ